MKIAPFLWFALLVIVVCLAYLFYRKGENYCGYCARDLDQDRQKYASEFLPKAPITAWRISNVANDSYATVCDREGNMINNITCSNPGGLILGQQLLESKLEEDKFTCLYSTTNDDVFIKYNIKPYNEHCGVLDSGAMKCQFWPARSCPNPTTLQVTCSAL